MILTSIGRKVGSFFVPLWILPPDVEERRLLSLPIPLAPFFLVGSFYAVWQAYASGSTQLRIQESSP